MGKTGLRQAVKVDLEKDPGTLPYLHVSESGHCERLNHS